MVKQIEILDGDRILISRTDRLGDLILAMPFVDTFKNSYPNCQVDVISSLYASPILENKDTINKIIKVQKDQLLSNKLYKKDLLQRIKKENYKAVIILFPDRQMSRLFFKAEIPIRIGTAGRFHSIFFSHLLMHSRKKNIKHESTYNLDFMQFFREGNLVLIPKVNLREKELLNAKKILESSGVSEKFILIHPGSGGSAESWSFENFIKLYGILKKEEIDLVITGSEAEGNKVDQIADEMNLDVKKITGETDLRTLAAVLSLAEVVIANSTGPLHLATAVGTKVVGLYPRKSAMSPVRWGPLGENHQIIQPDREECQCPTKQCNCMDLIDPKLVSQKVLDLLS
jgi:lipopolysaccharide heptosyltransferase II